MNTNEKIKEKDFILAGINKISFRVLYAFILVMLVSYAFHCWAMVSNGVNIKYFFIDLGMQLVIATVFIYISIVYRKTLKFYEMTVEHNKEYDILTGLPNRALFYKRLTFALNEIQRDNGNIAIMFIDLDNFKFINDYFGHDIGDNLLNIVGTRLMNCLRDGDTVSRHGGDEFIILLSNISKENVFKVAQRIIDIMSTPFIVKENEVFITTSIGISIYPSDSDSVKVLIQNANKAMYWAKKQGKNNFQFFTTKFSNTSTYDMVIANNLYGALSRKEFAVYYQPIVDTDTGIIQGVEALLRWKHPVWGMIPTDEFINLAERNGLIVHIGEWVLRTACKQIKVWQDAGLQHIRLAVNLSEQQLIKGNIVETLTNVLQETGLEPKYLELEVTERIMENTEETISLLYKLREMGISISIDDFGTGYSSLNRLKDFPINTIKIDKTFIQDIFTDAKDEAITMTIITLGHNLKLEVVAEGVETQEQLSFLKQHKCNKVQGYLFSPPLPVEEFEVTFISHGMITNTLYSSNN